MQLTVQYADKTLEIRTLYQQMDQLETQMRGLRSNTPDAAQATAADKESAGRLDNIAEVLHPVVDLISPAKGYRLSASRYRCSGGLERSPASGCSRS